MRPVVAGPVGRVVALGLALALMLLPSRAPAQQISKEKAAEMLLDSGRRAYNEGKYDFAAERFAEYVKTYREHQGRYSAQYGLAMSMLARPQRDYKAIGEAFRDALQWSALPERPFALYHYAASLRGLGSEAERQIQAKPAEEANLRKLAEQNYREAANQFSAAADSFEARGRGKPAEESARELEWAARARCDQAEMMLRVGACPEAQAVAQAVLGHARMSKGPYRALALYYLGYARFMQQDYHEAGRALSKLAPFDQDVGVHARYLLARTHHLSGDAPEAAAQYEAVLSGHEERKKQAAERLKDPKGLDAEQKADLESLVRGPGPEYVLRASFYAALLKAEAGKYDDAGKAFAELVQKHPSNPLVPEAQLRIGYCHLQAGRHAEAVKLLQPLTQHPQLGDQATWWLARANVAAADPKNAPVYQAALNAALGALDQAAQKAAERAKTDPAAKARRTDILMELADIQQLLGRYDDAAATYRKVIAEEPVQDRKEEAWQRQATALHLAGKYPESDAVCRRFEEGFPRSTLLPAVLFRSAENAFFTALAAEKDPAKKAQLPRLYDEAVRRYRRLMEFSTDFHYANLGRYGLATVYYRQGQYEAAAEMLQRIPPFERTGDLSETSYLLADCLLRTLPDGGEDAIAAARFVARTEEAAKLLEAYLAAAGKGPKVPETLLKLADCYRRIAEQVTDANERNNLLTRALQACERVQREFGNDPMVPMMWLERARCVAATGNYDQAINELRRFQGDPLRNSEVAPLALVRLAQLQRLRGRAAENVKLLEPYRQQREAELLKDPARRSWAAMLQYAHALALMDTKKPAEAVKLFEALGEQFPGRPEAINSAWRASQCRRELLAAELEAARRILGQQSAKPEQVAEARAKVRDALVQFRQTVARLQAEVENAAERSAGSRTYLRLLYEAAWCYRTLADEEVDAAREKLRQEALAKAAAALAAATPPGQAPPAPPVPEIALSQVPVQPMEMMARQQYERLIAAAAADELGVRAGLELAEMYAQREDNPESIAAAEKLLTDGLGRTPTPELAEVMRLRLASCLLARQKPVEALAHLKLIGPKPQGYHTSAQAQYLTAEALIQQKDWAGAVTLLKGFRDNERLRSVRELAERALLRLGQAHAEAGQWDESRQAFGTLLQQNRNSPWRGEALYGIAWAAHSQKRYDEAVKAYAEVTRETVGESAARAQYQIGRCLIEQKKYPEAVKELLVVPLTYGYPQWSAAARVEAAKACELMKESAQAARLYRQVLREHPGSQWARLARKQLDEME